MQIPLPIWVMILGIILIFFSTIIPELGLSWIGYGLLLFGALLVLLNVLFKRGD
jgi:hypothetical protein